ncbi:MAG: rhodanese-like domain-containing protein, partial [Chitinophagaceae bacterium]|nr:rhodanese-like domain-containing protein [Chitinophagaceae bacterium]
MFIQQLYTSCLSEAAYYIESNGEAAVIDPLRDIDAYLQLAASRNATIRYIFETHFHADFVSGHLDLQTATGATIVFGPKTQTAYPVHVAEDSEIFRIGQVAIKALHTPGHTLESTCWLLLDEAGKEHALFTGDTLFVGDVGRPDLSSGHHSSEELAAMLYDSLHQKIAPLADDILVYPAHGPGSACGKNLGPETHSTLGRERQSNYAFTASSREAFVEALTKGLSPAPAYFPLNAAINQKGYQPLDQLMAAGLQALSPEAFEQKMQGDEVLVVDSRKATEFTQGFVPDAISIGLEGRFAEWAGSLLPFDKTILVVADIGREQETITRLARVGFQHFGGFLNGGFAAWQQAGKPIDMVIDVEADELAMDLPFDDQLLVVDVRTEAEYGSGHVVGAMHLPLAELHDTMRIATLPEEANIYLHCASGYRSVIACSLLKRQGIHNVRNILG